MLTIKKTKDGIISRTQRAGILVELTYPSPLTLVGKGCCERTSLRISSCHAGLGHLQEAPRSPLGSEVLALRRAEGHGYSELHSR